MNSTNTLPRVRLRALTIILRSVVIGVCLAAATWALGAAPTGPKPSSILGIIAASLGIGTVDAIPWILLGIWWCGGIATGMLIGRWLGED